MAVPEFIQKLLDELYTGLPVRCGQRRCRRAGQTSSCFWWNVLAHDDAVYTLLTRFTVFDSIGTAKAHMLHAHTTCFTIDPFTCSANEASIFAASLLAARAIWTVCLFRSCSARARYQSISNDG